MRFCPRNPQPASYRWGILQVRRVVEAEMGRKLEDVFSDFQEQPIASASTSARNDKRATFEKFLSEGLLEATKKTP